MAVPANVAVRLQKMCVSFHGREVVRDANLALPGQGISAFVGRSGSGKTTLLRALNRLNEEFPGCVTSGRIEVDLGNGLEPVWPAAEAVRSLTALRRRIGMVFQTPNVFPVSVLRNLSIPLELVAECPRSEIADRAREALQAARLWKEVRDRLDVPAEHLSGGQQQRLCLARALALEPSLLLLDEPTASLDIHAARDVEELLQELSGRYPVLMVSHSLDQARRLAGRLVVLAGGTITHVFEKNAAPSEEELGLLLRACS